MPKNKMKASKTQMDKTTGSDKSFSKKVAETNKKNKSGKK
jgi:hypothetical protein